MGELIGIGAGIDVPEFVEKGVRQENADELVSRAEGLITRVGEEYKAVFMAEYKRLMTARLGLKSFKESDFDELYSELLDTMEAFELDFNQFFRKLSSLKVENLETEEGRKEQAAVFFHHEGITGLGNTKEAARTRVAVWLERWSTRVYEDWGPTGSNEERILAMKKVNPKFVPKNWVLDELIKRVEKGGEREILNGVMQMALNPFEEKWEFDEQEAERFCGDVPRGNRAMQCSCSS